MSVLEHNNKMKKATIVLSVCVLALLVAAAYADPLQGLKDAAKSVTDGVDKAVNGTKNAVTGATKSVTDGVDKAVNGTKNAVNTVGNGTKAAKDAVEGVGKAITGKSAAGVAAPSLFKVFAAAGCGTMLLMLLTL